MVSYGEVLGGALKFALQPKRWLPFFVLDAAFLMVAVSLLLTNFNAMLDLLFTTATSPAAALSLMSYAVLVVLGMALWYLLRLWVMGAVIHQAVKPKEFGKSWGVAKGRYFSLLAATVVVSVISALVAMIPFIGIILALVVSWMFFFIMPGVVANKLSFDNALMDSYKIFRKKYLTVFLIWLAITVVSLIITAVFMIPCLLVAVNAVAPLLGQMESSSIMLLYMLSLVQNIWLLVVCGLIFLIGVAISTAFALKAQTDFYLALKKKRFGLF